MTPLFISVLLAAMCLECRAQKDNVLQPKGDVTATEGEEVTLGCQYNSSSPNDYLFWYKQDGNNSPKFILSRIQRDEGNTPEEFRERFSSTLDSTLRSVPLKIQKLQLSDSAVYYCALRTYSSGGNKIIFGSGTKLHVNDNEEYKPSYYELVDGDTKACLATGFSKWDATQTQSVIFNNTEPVRISGDSLYNQVAVFSGDGHRCEQSVSSESESEKCVDSLGPGPIVNFTSLIILGLRLIFLKTIVFNVLMTLRLWISQ